MPDNYIKHLEQKLVKDVIELKSVRAKMEAEFEVKGAADGADVEKFDKMFEDGEKLKSKIKRFHEFENLEKFANGEETEEKTKQNQFVPATKGFKSWGETVAGSELFKNALKGGSRKSLEDGVEVKALSSTVAGSGGAAVFSDRREEIRDQARLAPTTLLDIMNVSTTDSNSIEFVAMTGYTNNAAEVLEWDVAQTPDYYGLKPESDMTFELKNEPVQTIAHWITTSRNLLADVPRLRNTLDVKMLQGIRRRLETQVIGGNGAAPNIRGIRNTPAIQTRNGATGSVSARYAPTDTILDTIRRGITDISLAFGQADAIVLNPADAERMELRKDDIKNYMNVYDPVAQRVWRVRVVENMAVPVNRGLVGAFNGGATLYIREEAVIRFFEQHADLAIRNALLILAEMRAALEVSEPKWFVDLNTLS